MDHCGGLRLRLTGLALLAFTAISHQSYFHLTLFILSLCLNAIFAIRRVLTPAAGAITLAAFCLSLHLFLLIIVQITYVQKNLSITFKRILGLSYFFCSPDANSGCEKHSWNVYVGAVTELCLASLLFWARRVSFSRIEYTTESQVGSIDLKQIYLLTPISIIFWALLFPSWLNFLWILASWLLFSLIGEKRHRLSAAPFTLTFASILLLLQYISGLMNFQGIMLEKLGLHSGVGPAAFYPLLIKMSLSVPFYMMRYSDGRYLEALSTFDDIETERIPNAPATSMRWPFVTATSLESVNRLEWIVPYICLFTCILYVCLHYMYVLIHGDWLVLSNYQWFSSAVRPLISALWLPFCFMFLLIFVYMKSLDTSVDILKRSTSVFVRTLATSYDTLIAVSLCCFARYNPSIAGIVLLMLSLTIFITTGQRCTLACLAATLLLSVQWLMSFVTYSFHLPTYIYPQNCTSGHEVIIDHNIAKWFGFSLNQTWPVIVLLLIISMRNALSEERSKWLIEVQRSDAEEDVTSLLKFLSKNWMYKFGVEVCSIVGVILACCHHDIFGLYFLVVVSFLRICRRWLQKSIWSSYTNMTLIVLIIEYLFTLGLPHQFSQCHDYFWSEWNAEVKEFFVLSFTISSSPIFITDFILLLLILIQKDAFNREKEHFEDDNTPLSEADFNQPIPALYNDFISAKGNLLAYIHTAVFLYSHWVSMIIILICSINDGTILSFGYIIAVFLFMWKGISLYACHSFKSVLIYWNCLVYYNIFLLAVKILYLDAFCKFGFAFPCWLERVIGLCCVSNECSGYYKKTSLVYDVICFVILIYQMRVFNSWYFQFVIMDYRADSILGSRGGKLLLELRRREAQKNNRRLQSNVRCLWMMIEEEDKLAPISIGSPPQSHEEIKRSGYYHQVSERFFPVSNSHINFEQEQTSFLIPRGFEESIRENRDATTMVEKTVEVLDSVRVTMMHIFQLLNNPEWLYRISKGAAFVAHVLDKDKKRIKEVLKDRLRIADTENKLRELHKDLVVNEDFQSVASSKILWNDALNEYRAIHPAFKFLYCFSHSIIAQSQLICFILMLIVHLSKSSLITFPLPLMVFFWGVLAIPRPSESFWLITASYIQFLIVFRLLFCNELVLTLIGKRNISDNNPFSVQRLLAMDPNINGSYWDIALLAMVFFHRYKLLRLGMWRNDFQVREQYLSLDDDTVMEEDNEKMGESTSCEKFCKALLMKKAQSSMDWYPWMVGCDVLCLILISFFYSMIGQGGSGNVLLDMQVARLPRWFACTLICVFVFMIVDRWLYLSKQTKFRFFYYVSLVVLLHVVIFLFVPSITGSMVTWNRLSISLYLIKSAYLLMSAWHMRNGYPSVMNRDILASGSGIFRLIILKIYLNIPFLFELRTVMDWTFTSTALTMADFIRMENYYNEVEAQHCWILFDHWLDNYFPTRKGRPTPTSGKFFKGVLSVVILIMIILAPILLFAFLNSLGTRAPPKRLHFKASIEGYPFLYSTDAVFNDETMSHLSTHNMQALVDELTNLEESDIKRRALSFISDYTFKDVFLINLTSDSLRNWDISLPGKKQLMEELQSLQTTQIVFEISLLRPVDSTQRWHEFILATALTSKQSKIFLDLINGNITTARMSFPLAQYLLTPPNGRLQPADAINLALKRIHSMSTWQYHGDYWSITWDQKFVIFVDRVVPSWMSIVVGSGGMVAMYVAVILVVGRFVREIVRTPIHNAMIENIPNCENLLRLFHDIYVVREKHQFYLESRLYGKLVFLMRSPETLIRWCRYRVKVKNE
uniref:Piezo non-specific cation channel R-Ras-binding domain-containing protein n=2 Tax=Wuchereria bancrofti TaxID=6293 RepID=A0AAF5Q0T2_WUCBA